MKTNLFAAIALAVASMPLTFAAQAPKTAAPANTSSTSTVAGKPAAKSTKKSAKTHAKKSTKSVTNTASKPSTASTTTAVKK